jgi:hypothetical protein
VGDQTSGNGSIAFSGVGINNAPLFTMSGTGNAVFTMPSTVTKLDITGTYSGIAVDFTVWVGSLTSACGVITDGSCRLLVNMLMGTAFGPTSYDSGTIQTGGGGIVSIENSVGVSWSMVEVR